MFLTTYISYPRLLFLTIYYSPMRYIQKYILEYNQEYNPEHNQSTTYIYMKRLPIFLSTPISFVPTTQTYGNLGRRISD